MVGHAVMDVLALAAGTHHALAAQYAQLLRQRRLANAELLLHLTDTHFFRDGERFSIGDVEVTALHVPGHTPADMAYLVDGAVFVGDTLFMPRRRHGASRFPRWRRASALPIDPSPARFAAPDSDVRVSRLSAGRAQTGLADDGSRAAQEQHPRA